MFSNLLKVGNPYTFLGGMKEEIKKQMQGFGANPVVNVMLLSSYHAELGFEPLVLHFYSCLILWNNMQNYHNLDIYLELNIHIPNGEKMLIGWIESKN